MESTGGVKGVVRERIGILLGFAEKEAKRNPARSARYVSLARRLGTRFRVRLSPESKRRFCKACGTAWVHGFNVKARLDPKTGKVVYSCACGGKKGFPFKRGRAGR
ncbi:MAG: ribonuclease P [Candidatus ainarchaeum sp.]|nr:ribonuclease P [Candidatus ainarchaeum sp.]